MGLHLPDIRDKERQTLQLIMLYPLLIWLPEEKLEINFKVSQTVGLHFFIDVLFV